MKIIDMLSINSMVVMLDSNGTPFSGLRIFSLKRFSEKTNYTEILIDC